jgi:hypothetical protein
MTNRIQTFTLILTKLLVLYPHRELSDLESDLRFEGYNEALADFTIEEIGAAAQAAIRQAGRVFMPTPGEWIELALAERRRVRDAREKARALPAPPALTDSEQAAIRTMIEELREKLGTGPGGAHDKVDAHVSIEPAGPPTPTEWAQHEARRQDVLRTLRAAGQDS